MIRFRSKKDALDSYMIPLEVALSFYVIGILPSEDIPDIACKALEDGFDSEALRRLAGVGNPIMSEVAPLFEKALADAGLVTPNIEQAAIHAAKYYASRILDGDLSPYDGASLIWRQVSTKVPLPQLDIFVFQASEYEDFDEIRQSNQRRFAEYYSALIKECEEQIRAAARQLIAS